MAGKPNRLYSAVVDPSGVFPMQAARLVWSLTELAGVSKDNIVLCVVGDAEGSVRSSLERLGVELVQANPYPGHPFCNKLQQLEYLDRKDFDDVVLLDCDVLVLEEPPGSEGSVLGKPVDLGNPPVELLHTIFTEAELILEPAAADLDGVATARANVNGGVYVIDRALYSRLAQAWSRWADWCLDHLELFADYEKHVDQVSFALAVAAERLPFKELPRRFNIPTHLAQPEELDCDPAILHYHDAVDAQQFLMPVAGLKRINAAIEQVNSRLSSHRRESFDNATFWGARYATHPELGSGLGSRGEVLEQKRNLLSWTVEMLGASSIIDVGGGDGLVSEAIPQGVSVIALDVAASARDLYLERVPNALWLNHDICEAPAPGRADLTVCFDLLIHQADRARYDAAVSHLAQAGGSLLVSGFDAPPIDFGPMTYFHEPLSVSLRRHGHTGIPVDSYRETAVFLVLPERTADVSRDLTDSTLGLSLPLVQRPSLLAQAIVRSRSAFGFFPDHLPRCIEYPWMLEQLQSSKTLRVIDAGAGVSVLPLLLADRGHEVTTVDPHPLVRNGTPRETWNEWGFLDYSELHPRILSEQVAYEDSAAKTDIDVVVSVSVVEHLPARVRRGWFEHASRQLVPGGRLLLTVDTVPFSDQLWCYSEGSLVEDPQVHGTVQAMLQELEEAGFQVVEVERSNWLPCSRVGMARISAQR